MCIFPGRNDCPLHPARFVFSRRGRTLAAILRVLYCSQLASFCVARGCVFALGRSFPLTGSSAVGSIDLVRSASAQGRQTDCRIHYGMASFYSSCSSRPFWLHKLPRRLRWIRDLSRNDSVENTLMQFERPFCRGKRGVFQRWNESLNGEWPTNVTKGSLLPKGEGQDEGEPGFTTERPVIRCRSEKPAVN